MSSGSTISVPLGSGAITGIVVGILVLVSFAAIALFLVHRKNSRKRAFCNSMVLEAFDGESHIFHDPNLSIPAISLPTREIDEGFLSSHRTPSPLQGDPSTLYRHLTVPAYRSPRGSSIAASAGDRSNDDARNNNARDNSSQQPAPSHPLPAIYTFSRTTYTPLDVSSPPESSISHPATRRSTAPPSTSTTSSTSTAQSRLHRTPTAKLRSLMRPIRSRQYRTSRTDAGKEMTRFGTLLLPATPGKWSVDEAIAWVCTQPGVTEALLSLMREQLMDGRALLRMQPEGVQFRTIGARYRFEEAVEMLRTIDEVRAAAKEAGVDVDRSL
ncbi:hypothetical protein BC830DRAFT_255994 [Chytriomyces sp. MP71]|nr:hypothetical protein BC830DRAFT_255994 [Chytriomyces sp. MP71]